jgi:hypothetical protein
MVRRLRASSWSKQDRHLISASKGKSCQKIFRMVLRKCHLLSTRTRCCQSCLSNERMAFTEQACAAMIEACPAEALLIVERSIGQPSLCTWVFPWPLFGGATLMERRVKIFQRSVSILEYSDETLFTRSYATKTMSSLLR